MWKALEGRHIVYVQAAIEKDDIDKVLVASFRVRSSGAVGQEPDTEHLFQFPMPSVPPEAQKELSVVIKNWTENVRARGNSGAAVLAGLERRKYLPEALDPVKTVAGEDYTRMVGNRQRYAAGRQQGGANATRPSGRGAPVANAALDAWTTD